MKEDFRCAACGNSFGYEFGQGRATELSCPKCKQMWKLEDKIGRFRLSMWL
jgi:phage FluMu protein Com